MQMHLRITCGAFSTAGVDIDDYTITNVVECDTATAKNSTGIIAALA